MRVIVFDQIGRKLLCRVELRETRRTKTDFDRAAVVSNFHFNSGALPLLLKCVGSQLREAFAAISAGCSDFLLGRSTIKCI